jgi:hypothetical protein
VAVVLRANRDALVGALAGAGFGVAWAWWAASGLSGVAAGATRVLGTVFGVAITAALLVTMARGRQREPVDGTGSMFASRGYLLVVGAELAALIGGNLALTTTGHDQYVVVWVATVAGVHFVGFGALFWPGFYWLGATLMTGAACGLIVGLAGGSRPAIVATTALIAAASLLAAASAPLFGRRRPLPSPGAADGMGRGRVRPF